MRTLHWALGSGDSVKEYVSSTFPYIEFPGWRDPDSVQAFIDRMKERLQDDGSKDGGRPNPSCCGQLLHKRLTRRFRPITTAIRRNYQDRSARHMGKYNRHRRDHDHIMERRRASKKLMWRTQTVSFFLYTTFDITLLPKKK